MTKLSGPMLAPASGGPPRQLVVLLHGYGSDGNDLIALGGHWRASLPEALFVAPNAPDPCADSPYGFQWFPVDLRRTLSVVDGAQQARPVMVEFLRELWEQSGLSAAETFLAGFSQGAMVALHVGLSLDTEVLGIVAFSGALIPPDGWETEQLPKPPVCLVHGDVDTVVDPRLSQEAAVQLQAHGYEVRYHSSPGTAHGISPDGLEFASQFLGDRIAAASD